MITQEENRIRDRIKEKLCEILEQELVIGDLEELQPFGMDSMKNIRLAVELEMCFDISIADHEWVFENFRTVRRIADMVQRNFPRLAD